MTMTPKIPIYLLDGGLGTTLEDTYDYVFNESTPLWSSQLLLSSQATLLSAQTGFAKAGADVILSATYQASFEGFERCGVEEQEAGRSMRSAVGISRRAFGNVKNRDGGENRGGINGEERQSGIKSRSLRGCHGSWAGVLWGI
jgi:homocysteine S-methyltransferase